MTKPSPRIAIRDEQGFSLVETLVAFAILSIVMTIGVQILGNGTLRTRAAETRALALGYAQSRLAELSASALLPAGRTEGIFKDGYRWRLTVSPLAEGRGAMSMAPHLVAIEVLPLDHTAGTVSLTTILLAAPAGPES